MKKIEMIGGRDIPKGIPATATVVLGGVTYGLAFHFSNIAETESESGVNLLLALTNIGGLSAQALRGLLLAGIRAVEPMSKLTIGELSGLINIENIFAITEAIAETILASSPEAKAAV